jgi:hypothetical protein
VASGNAQGVVSHTRINTVDVAGVVVDNAHAHVGDSLVSFEGNDSGSGAVGVRLVDSVDDAVDGEVSVHGVTIAGGDASQTAVEVESAGAGTIARAWVTSTILDAGTSIRCGQTGFGQAEIELSHSAYAAPTVNGCGLPAITEAATVPEVPAFAPGTLVPSAGSSAIDAGHPMAAGLDLAGQPRVQDGDGDGEAMADIGAFEASAPTPVGGGGGGGGGGGAATGDVPVPVTDAPVDAPPADAGAGSAEPPAGVPADLVAPRVTKLRGRGRTLRFRLSEDATVTVRRGQRVVAARTARAGQVAVRVPRGARGARLTLVAADAAGNASAPRTLRLRAKR